MQQLVNTILQDIYFFANIGKISVITFTYL